MKKGILPLALFPLPSQKFIMLLDSSRLSASFHERKGIG